MFSSDAGANEFGARGDTEDAREARLGVAVDACGGSEAVREALAACVRLCSLRAARVAAAAAFKFFIAFAGGAPPGGGGHDPPFSFAISKLDADAFLGDGPASSSLPAFELVFGAFTTDRPGGGGGGGASPFTLALDGFDGGPEFEVVRRAACNRCVSTAVLIPFLGFAGGTPGGGGGGAYPLLGIARGAPGDGGGASPLLSFARGTPGGGGGGAVLEVTVPFRVATSAGFAFRAISWKC